MLGNFTYSNPTHLHFGKDSLDSLSEELARFGNRVLLVYGGFMPNPTVEKLYESCF